MCLEVYAGVVCSVVIGNANGTTKNHWLTLNGVANIINGYGGVDVMT